MRKSCQLHRHPKLTSWEKANDINSWKCHTFCDPVLSFGGINHLLFLVTWAWDVFANCSPLIVVFSCKRYRALCLPSQSLIRGKYLELLQQIGRKICGSKSKKSRFYFFQNKAFKLDSVKKYTSRLFSRNVKYLLKQGLFISGKLSSLSLWL